VPARHRALWRDERALPPHAQVGDAAALARTDGASIAKREKLASEGKLFRKHARALASGAVIGRDSSSIDAASDEDVLRVSRELYRRLKDAIDSR
jgi:hypothetical protein